MKLIAAASLAVMASGSFAQITRIDPNTVSDPGWEQPAAPQAQSEYQPVDPGPQDVNESRASEESAATPDNDFRQRAETSAYGGQATVPREDVFNAAEGVFGKGAEGLASMIEKLLQEQGEPNAYISGREAGGAFVLGVRYGSGTLHHQVEGDRPIYWTGPSVGFDFGADASKVFVLVYNLYDSQRIFSRYPAAEGHAYVVGGFTASYLRKGDVVLIPVRLGVGLRLGVNAGYMNFTEKNRWLPF
ncbi:DUF1134 domain-containing protein [Sphingosinicella rhizophila]|uniref:DUF1134 domain-containing protein n=1 Tax=Sphingosinicella rhizophila TaxID=3050082 RepID=A0ABU3Q7F2_9SPHN|nr:DUF1134 domain-containing protein [Sphingosinicella sp. GR2756]MDT9599324.1 DUF1134 domain-containing protein [Sphingosinicella sp. GR2756]